VLSGEHARALLEQNTSRGSSVKSTSAAMEVESAEQQPGPEVENLRVVPADVAERWLAPGDGSSAVRRLCIDIRGRAVTMLAFADGRLLAVDTKCYHLGGALGGEGEIEDLVLEPGSAPEAVIRCPWHGRTMRLSSGQQVDVHLDGQVFFSDAPVQRTYVAYREADGAVHMLWPLAPELIPSDLVNGPTPRAPISSAAHESSTSARVRRAEVMRQRQCEHRQHAGAIKQHHEAAQAQLQDASFSNTATAEERTALYELYSKHRPGKLPNLESLIAKYGGRQLLAAARDKYESVRSDQDAVETTPVKQMQDEATAGMTPVKVTGHLQAARGKTGARRQMCAR
jgi:nitrite reductase/ring-hydroxylating ferredoxin subunit